VPRTPTIVLDPGHGGSVAIGKSTPFGQCHASGQHEKVWNLLLAERVGAALGDHEVLLTRHDDRNLSLRERTAVAGIGRPIQFVSLHTHWDYPGSQGCEAWVHPRAGGPSRQLASNILHELAQLGAGPGEVLRGDLAVLDPALFGAGAAACLVEAQLPSDSFGNPQVPRGAQIDAIAAAIARGIRGAGTLGRPTPRFGGVDVEVGSDNWAARAREAFDGGEVVNLVIAGPDLQQLMSDAYTEALRRGWDLLDAGLSTINSILDAAGEYAGKLRARLKQVLPYPFSEALAALPAAAVVLIIVVIALFVYLIAEKGLNFMSDRDLNDTVRYCAERGDVDVDFDRSSASGLDVSKAKGEGGLKVSGNGKVKITCKPRQ
jgi:hypothetical protein